MVQHRHLARYSVNRCQTAPDGQSAGLEVHAGLQTRAHIKPLLNAAFTLYPGSLCSIVPTPAMAKCVACYVFRQRLDWWPVMSCYLVSLAQPLGTGCIIGWTMSIRLQDLRQTQPSPRGSLPPPVTKTSNDTRLPPRTWKLPPDQWTGPVLLISSQDAQAMPVGG